MLATTCYTREELERYLYGRADDELSGAIELHVASCSRCEDTLSELDADDDTLIRTLQVKGSHQDANPPAWVERLANMPVETGEQRSEPDDDASTEPPEELGDYELVSVLGRGGMSVVFAARHKHLGRGVALKVLLPTTQQHAISRDRFAREMRAVGGLDHSAIVRATDAGEWNETLYLVMEQIDGVDLNRVARIEGPLSVADTCAIGIEVALGLAHAHDQGVVHRDIKPSNLMLDRDGHVKILDFGLARVQSASCDVSLQTTMGQLLGTLDYMAPEQASGTEVDARADIYALGATLFKLLTGAPPHGRSADMPIIEYLNRLATSEAAQLDEHRDHLPSELVELIGTMLQRDPARRIATAEDVAERLRPFAAETNLQELAADAIEQTADSPENVPSIKESLAELGPRPLPSDARPQKPLPPTNTTGSHPINRVGCAGLATGVASLLGLVALTIVLTLKSSEGEIRIESELDNVKVEVVDEKDRVETIAVDHGRASTTVRAGRYRIRLDSPSDGIEVTPHEVTVKRKKTVIAKVRKISSVKPSADGDPKQRDPLVAMEAQLQLEETAAELAEAKKQPNPNAELIKTLEEKLASLRALSRPIPTEPVYEGRTLADWVAQMKFEQEENARKTAAENVLKLAVTRPSEEQIELILNASLRLFAWHGRPIDERLCAELFSTSANVTKTAQLITDADREVAFSHLERKLRSQDPEQREHALWLCTDLRNQIRRGDAPALLTALEMRIEFDTAKEKALAQLTLAVCVPDVSRATELLISIDTDTASAPTMLATILAANERKLRIPRDREVAWAKTYLDKISHPSELDELWRFGPFSDVDWDRVDDSLQADINTLVGPLLHSFKQQLADVFDSQNDQQLQFKAALKSKILTQIIEQANLTGDTSDNAVTLLNYRLEQLIQFRSQAEGEPGYDMDTPAAVAAAIMLLTGSVPESIKRSAQNESGYMAEQMAAARKTLLPPDARTIMMRGGGRARPSGDPRLADWCPYELLRVLHHAESRMRTAIPDSERSGRSSRTSLLSQISRFQPSWQVDLRLMIDYAVSSGNDNRFPLVSAAEFVSEFASTSTGTSGFAGSGRALRASSATPHLVRHPQFAKVVTEWMEKVQDQQAVEFAFELWSTAWSTEQAEAKLHAWLRAGDATRTRAAIQELRDRNRRRFPNEWAKEVAEAIDRIAENQQLNSRDLFYLDSLGDKAPKAASHAIRFLTFWLDNPDERALPGEIAGMGAVPPLRNCVNILLRFPQQAKQIRTQVEQALKESKDAFSSEDRAELGRLLDFTPEMPE